MTFKSNNQNPLGQLVELKTKLVPDDDQGSANTLLVELRANPEEIEDKIGTISVSIKEATLVLTLHGLDIVSKSRLGQPTTGAPVHRELQRETTITTAHSTADEGKAGLSVGISTEGPKAELKVGIGSSENMSASLIRRETEIIREEFHPVRAISGDRWKVTMKDGGALDATFLDGDPLCRTTSVKGANLLGVESEVIVKQKHLDVKLDRDPSWLSLRFPRTTNQQKIMKVLIAKSLHEKSGTGDFDGELTFSRSSVFDEE
ncbi:hypothetical protein FJ417_03335 [Mesorhizobium sp. B3-1-7]|uniref:hypothetical protein n=1 Tax=Mesorhizobium sp. B3-1-7 TaxID=2589894 RepID=UPI00112DC5A4|nr:hypothetical protein [Mesorhizobium sp. B3-1-7]TPI63949.1 hypothetical protein FJ417_03335 [Mesorhizobium sp. B3-1-7]